MTALIASLAEISDRYDAVLCDLWGCLHNGHAPYPAAVAALQAFRRKGGRVVLLTNAPRPNVSVIRHLDRMGVPHDAYDLVVSSGDATQEAMVAGMAGRRIYHIGAPKDESFFTEMQDAPERLSQIARVALDEAEGIVCTGLADDLTETPEDYRAVLLSAKVKGLKMLCANPDIIVDYADKRLWCAGALARDYEDMGGEALYFGKPHAPAYALARRRLEALGLSVANDRLLAIGDGIDTDVRGGLAEGIDTLFVTGGISATDFGPDPLSPDAGKLKTWLEARKLSPTAAIPRLA
ncbi:MAG: TIGR01459 family HAD-type hydrolase, partial [Paracoccaceae bacterium]|nr:TIGR01459 family HAD-type hydrolase [Paracoccaceae bacterium]